MLLIQRKYDCELAHEEGWYLQAKNTKSKEVEIRYDKRNMTHIYIIDSK